jgi:hypothetical protein
MVTVIIEKERIKKERIKKNMKRKFARYNTKKWKKNKRGNPFFGGAPDNFAPQSKHQKLYKW